MALCTSNLTLAVYVRRKEFLGVSPEGNRLTGIIGKFLDDFFVFKNQRNCTFWQIDYFKKDEDKEGYESNDTAVYLLKKGFIDLYPLPEDISYVKSYLETSKTTSITSFMIGQILTKPDKLQKADISSFLLNNRALLFITIIGYLLFFLFIFAFLKKVFYIYNSTKIIKLILFKLLFLNDKQLQGLSSEIAIIFVFFNFFLLIFLNIVRNCIKTDKVVINTDEFIDSDNRLDETPKILTIIHNDEELFSKSPERTLMNRLYYKKLKNEKFFMTNKHEGDEEFRELEKNGLANHFFLMTKTSLLVTLASLTYSENQFLFMKQKSYSERISVIYMRKDLDEIRKKFVHER